MLLRRKELILVGVIYYRPDYAHLLNEFYLQMEDDVPDMPRVHRFLLFWKNNIEATIKEVIVSVAANEYRSASFHKVLH